jgi:hypothetical protein
VRPAPTTRYAGAASLRARATVMPEEDFLDSVVRLAHLYGWRSFHARPAMTAKGPRTAVAGDGVGFPDLVLVHPRHGLICAELKRVGGRPDPAQEEWRAALLAAGVAVYVWWPTDLERLVSVALRTGDPSRLIAKAQS